MRKVGECVQIEAGSNVYTKEYIEESVLVLSDYAKVQILTPWREGFGPTMITEQRKNTIRTTRKSVSLFMARYTQYIHM